MPRAAPRRMAEEGNMARSKTADVYEAAETFVVEIDGVPTYVEKGKTRVHKSSAVYRSNPHLFVPLEVEVPDIEQATDAPGERRGSR